MPPQPRHVLAALLFLPLVLLGGCRLEERAHAVRDTATACAEALELTDVIPGGADLDAIGRAAERRAGQLRDIAEDIHDNDIGRAVRRLADVHLEITREQADTAVKVVDWVARVAADRESLRKACR